MEDLHLDRGSITQIDTTDEGFVRFIAHIAKAGKYVYLNRDGSTREEVVSEKVLYNPDSLETFAGKPLLLGHPPEKEVNPDNYQNVRVTGAIGNKFITTERPFLTVVGMIHDREGISAIESGKAKELSCGYWAATEPRADGKLDQVFRRGNHVAQEWRGRHGSKCAIPFYPRVDSSEEVEVWYSDRIIEVPKTPVNLDRYSTNIQNTNSDNMGENNRGVRLDGVEFQVPPDLAEKIGALQARADKAEADLKSERDRADKAEGEVAQLKTDKASIEAERDDAKTKLDVKESEPRLDADEIADRVAARTQIWHEVLPTLRRSDAAIEPDYKLDTAQVQRLYLQNVSPELVAKADAMPPDEQKTYLAALYDLKARRVDAEENAIGLTRSHLDAFNSNASNITGNEGGGKSPEERRKEDMARRKNRSLPGLRGE